MKKYNGMSVFLLSICIVFEVIPDITIPKIKRTTSIPADYFLGIACAEYPAYEVLTKSLDGQIVKNLIVETHNKKTRLARYVIDSGIAFLGICFFCYILREYTKLPITNQ